MAALRVAARRLVGGGQTPAVAVDKAQRRLFPRLSQVGRARSTTSSAAAAAAADTNVAATTVSHAERTYSIPGRAGKHISRLHEELAVQVDPRPGDSTCWYVLMCMAAGKIVELDPDEKQWIQKKRGEARKQSETK
uniref:Uncharacterized protein n=1 Tax=Aegilops tauschii TaxID=37682 RepID=N1QTE4_AEGTA